MPDFIDMYTLSLPYISIMPDFIIDIYTLYLYHLTTLCPILKIYIDVYIWQSGLSQDVFF